MVRSFDHNSLFIDSRVYFLWSFFGPKWKDNTF
ncbi:hypothetical protein AERO8C_70126 [Aeromonas veronii]|uniref:Uncharacterized protein n=1 Tax=Aeromonas veronii TaxID=654 RepID=A0A653LA62_AERVE|nr:hypothetical protein AERO8C_70126 [Aeromonas veronii]